MSAAAFARRDAVSTTPNQLGSGEINATPPSSAADIARAAGQASQPGLTAQAASHPARQPGTRPP